MKRGVTDVCAREIKLMHAPEYLMNTVSDDHK